MSSDKSKELYAKNVKRITDAGFKLNDHKNVVEWIETVKSKRGKPFSDSTKRNIFTALINTVSKNTKAYSIYKKQQDKYNDILFKKYEKDGTVNKQKTEEVEANFTQEDYNKLINSLLVREKLKTKFTETYGMINGKEISKEIESDFFSDRVFKNMPIQTETDKEAYIIHQTPEMEMIAFILIKMFYLYNFRNEIGNLIIIQESDFNKKFKSLDDPKLKDKNYLLVDNNDYTIVRTQYKTDKKYGVIKTAIKDKELINAITSYIYSFRLLTWKDFKGSIKQYKWTKKSLKSIGESVDIDTTKSKTNFQYKPPLIDNYILDKKLRTGYLFPGETGLSSAQLSARLQNIGKKYLDSKYPITPTMIVKLSNKKYSKQNEELKEKAKNRGHSADIQSKIYIPK